MQHASRVIMHSDKLFIVRCTASSENFHAAWDGLDDMILRYSLYDDMTLRYSQYDDMTLLSSLHVWCYDTTVSSVGWYDTTV